MIPSLPAWTALTVYATNVRITKATSDGTNWQAQAGGTSAATEPTWPTAAPWTVVDGTVTWALASSFRQLVVRGIVTTLTSFQTANPTLLKGILPARPKAGVQVDCPAAFILDRPETIRHQSQNRQRTMTPSVVLLLNVPDNIQAMQAADMTIDGLTDAFTAAYHSANGFSITQETDVVEVPWEEGTVPYLAFEFKMLAYIMEGRN